MPYSKVLRLFRNCVCSTLFGLLAVGNVAQAQSEDARIAIPSGKFVVTKSGEQLQLVVNTSKLLELPSGIASANVHNDAVVQVRPMSRNQLMVSAKTTGVTQIDLFGPDKSVSSVQVVVIGDARELDAILQAEFPTAAIKIKPINNSLILSGQVTSDQDLEHAVSIAEKYYPEVINRIQVIGVHTIMLHTQVLEVSRTKLRELGIDWGMTFGSDTIASSVGGIATSAGGGFNTIGSTGRDTFRFGIVDNGNGFFGLVRALRQNNLVKVMADPTVVAVDGRPASFNSGGEFPILVPAGLGQVAVEFREYGTRLDFVAKVRGDSRIYLEVRPMVSEIDPTRTVTLSGLTVPGLRSRYVDTAVELRAGQTLALAGLLQVRTETESIGMPGLAEIPYLGAFFRANKEVQSEVELLVLVTPDFAGAMDPAEVPAGGPGFNSGSPTDKDLYIRGHSEVPATCGVGNCLPGTNMQSPNAMQPMPIMHSPAPVIQPGYGHPAGGHPAGGHPAGAPVPSQGLTIGN